MLWVLLVLVVLYVSLLLGVARFSLHPLRTPLFLSPAFMNLPQEDVVLESGVLRLRAWWVPAQDARSVLVMVHGYLMNRAELTPLVPKLHERGVSCLLIDLRAHGKSGGRKCTLGYREREDVAAALRWARERAGGKPVGVIGSSMGAAASALAVGDDPSLADFLVMDSGYSRLSVAILGWWNFLGGRKLQIAMAPTVYLAAPMAGFSPFSVDIAAALARAGAKPVLHLHGRSDTLAPASEAERNHSACVGASELVFFDGMGHAEYRWERPSEYFPALLGFLERHGYASPATSGHSEAPR